MVLAAGSVAMGVLAVTGTAFAAPNSPLGPGPRPAAVGIVSAISGDTLTVVSKGPPMPPKSTGVRTSTTYTVNATNASVMKDGKSSTLSTISVGNRVAIWGTVNGSNVTATKIRVDVPLHKVMGLHRLSRNFHGNGDPVVGGSVVAVNGTTLTITNAKKMTYTVNASSSTIEKMGGATTSLSNVVVGDRVIVQGVFSGTSVTASSILDQGITVKHPVSLVRGAPKPPGHFFGSVGFFEHLFGF